MAWRSWDICQLKTPLRSVLRRPGRTGLKKVVFVSYGTFDCNSAGHIAGFAAELRRLGLAVGVCGRGDPLKAYAWGPPEYEFLTLQDLSADPKAVIGFDGEFDP